MKGTNLEESEVYQNFYFTEFYLFEQSQRNLLAYSKSQINSESITSRPVITAAFKKYLTFIIPLLNSHCFPHPPKAFKSLSFIKSLLTFPLFLLLNKYPPKPLNGF